MEFSIGNEIMGHPYILVMHCYFYILLDRIFVIIKYFICFIVLWIYHSIVIVISFGVKDLNQYTIYF